VDECEDGDLLKLISSVVGYASEGSVFFRRSYGSVGDSPKHVEETWALTRGNPFLRCQRFFQDSQLVKDGFQSLLAERPILI